LKRWGTIRTALRQIKVHLKEILCNLNSTMTYPSFEQGAIVVVIVW